MDISIPQFRPYLGDTELEGIKDCFATNWITEGPKCEAFRDEVLKICGAKYGVLAPNGTLALYMALKVLGIGEDDEVIVPDFTMIASANAVLMTGAALTFVGVDEHLQIDVDQLERVITRSFFSAIMPVHMYGMAANMPAIMKLARKHNFFVVEDACQGLGVMSHGKGCGSYGDANAFSFFADKTITTGEGGMVTTNNKETYDKLLHYRNQGRLGRGSFIHPEMGSNLRMTDIQGAMGLAQIDKFTYIVGEKHRILDQYKEGLKGVEEVTFLEPSNYSTCIPFRVVIFAEDAIAVEIALAGKGIETRSCFYPMHMQPCFDGLRCIPVSDTKEEADYSNSIRAEEQGLCLPTFVGLKEREIKSICDAIKEVYVRSTS